MLRAVTRLVKRLNWARRRWSTASDRTFHDALFSTQSYDPLSLSYPGYLTIRRFADLAMPSVSEGDTVVDLGCGTGEITSELARRLPGCQFVGIDHSLEGVAQGQRLAARLQLGNVRFQVGDMEAFELHERVELITMFDSFHHLLKPSDFVRRLASRCDKFFLIEPAGNWLGDWQRTLDVDWLAESILTIRDRLEYQFGLTPDAPSRPASAPASGVPVEHRHAIDDFYQWFSGFGVDIRGTIAGLELYGTAGFGSSALRDELGECIYRLVMDLETTLRHHDLDLAAKHWAIAAARGRVSARRTVPDVLTRAVERPMAGPYDASYRGYDGPQEVRAGSDINATITVVNRSWRVWDSQAREKPVCASYHWLNSNGTTVVEDGLRSPLPRPLAPGDSCDVSMHIRCPEAPGRYTLAIDFVHEEVCWFSGAGVAPLRMPVSVS
jgi:SAM-dependent methyltransferase